MSSAQSPTGQAVAKPHPSRVVTHRSMDALLRLLVRQDPRPEQVAHLDFHAASNILDPIGHPAAGQLQARFSMAALHRVPAIGAQGFERIRSRLEVTLHDGRSLVEWAEKGCRGGPALPMTGAELEGTFADLASSERMSG